MAHTIKLGNFKKHENSTAQPNAESWAEFSITYKGGADLDNPTVTISADFTAIKAYNYAVLDNRYYFIRSRNMLRSGFSVLDLMLDPMATYKKEIGAASLYVIRSAAAYNGYIKDNYYPMLASKTTSGEIIDSDDIPLGSGSYIVNILGNNTANSTLYLLSPAQFNSFLNALLAAVGPYVGLDFQQAKVNAIFEPLQYIKSILWMPLSVAAATSAFGATAAGNICAGLWDSGVPGLVLNTGAALVRTRSVTIPKHPDAAARGAYLNGAPFTNYVLNYPPFGVINVDPAKLIDETSININIYADAVTGLGIMQGYGTNTGGPLFNLTAQYGVPIPLSGAASNFSAVASTIGAAGELIGGLLTGNLALAAMGAAQGIGSFGDSVRGVISSGGSAGSLAAWQTGKTFGATFHDIADEDLAHNGRPLCEIRQISTLPGYNIVQYGDVEIPGTIVTQQTIRRYLETGFYYE